MKGTKYGLKTVKKKESERGVILLIVIIIISVLTIVVGDMIYFTHIDTAISSNTKDELSARYIAKSGIHVAAGTMKVGALEELTEITTTLNKGTNYSEGYWAIIVPFFPVGEGGVTVTVIDERSKINLNALVSRSSNRVDQQVLTELKELFRFLEVDESKSERFIASLINWTDAPLEGATNNQDSAGADGGFYSSLEEPYGIKDGPLDSMHEIRMIDGMDDEFFGKIKDYVTVYPGDKKINFSTAPKAVLMAAIKGSAVPALNIEGQETGSQSENQEEESSKLEVTDDIAEQIADEILQAREDEPIVNQKKVRDIAKQVDTTSEISAGLVGVVHNTGRSDIFSVNAIGSLGEYNPTKRVVEAVLRKTEKDNRQVVDIISWKEL